MKKQMILKRIAPILVVFCIFATILPTTVFAADTPKITLKSGEEAPSTIYTGHSYTLTVQGERVKFYTSNKKIATIGVTTGKMSVTAPGTVTITAKNVKTKKTIATKTFKVNQRAKSISTNKREVYLPENGKDAYLPEYDREVIQAILTPITSTDVVRFYSDDTTVAQVGLSSGIVWAREKGHCQIKVYAKATKATANSSKYNKIAVVDVYVGADMKKVEQDGKYLAVSFKSASVPKTTPEDYRLVNKATKQEIPVKNVSIREEKAVLEMTEALQIGEEYILHCGETSLPITFAPYGVGDLRLKYKKIIGAPMSLTVQTFASENSVMPLDEYDLNDLPRNIKASIQTENGYVTSDNKLVLRQFGHTATVTATYHTNRWNTKGEEEGNITKEFTITADENAFINYKIERVEYTYTGTSEDYITVQLNYPLNQDYKVMMGWPKHFQLQIQSPYPSDSNWFRKYIVYSTKRVGEGNRIIISFPSDQLYDGGTYVLRVFGFGTALSHQSEPFTIHKRTYYPSAPTPTPTPDGPTTDTDGSDKDDTGDTMPPTDGDDDNNGDTPPTDRDDDNNGDTPPTGTGDSENNDNTPATDKK